MDFDLLPGLVFPYINFAIFFGVLVFALRKPLAEALAKRSGEYEKMAREAQLLYEEAIEQNKQLEKRLQAQASELQALRKDAGLALEAEKKRILDDAKHYVQILKEEASQLNEFEIARVRAQIRSELISEVTESITASLKQDGAVMAENRKRFFENQLVKLSGYSGVRS